MPNGEERLSEEPEELDESDKSEGRYSVLPAHVPIEDTIPTKETSPAPDPEMGRNTKREFLLRYGGFG